MELAAQYRLSADDPQAFDPDTDAIIEAHLKEIYESEKAPQALIADLYFHTAAALIESYKKGYEKTFFGANWSMSDNNLLTRVQANIFAFSGAKSYAQVKELRDMVYQDGKLVPWTDYRQQARAINAKYNLSYLDTERQAVIAAGTQGSRWVDIEDTKETHPFLEYVTARDGKVRPEHAALDGIILPMDDPFWESYYPPNGYRCRCYVRRHTERNADHRRAQYEARHGQMPDSDMAQKIGSKAADKLWRHNVGTSGVFDTGHPYFRASKAARDMQLSAVRNYGMKPVARIYDSPGKLAKYGKGLQTGEDYADFWARMEAAHGTKGTGGFTLVDQGNEISAFFGPELREKLINRERSAYFDEVTAVFQDPDEVWGVMREGRKPGMKREYFNAYVRYYEDCPVILLVDGAGVVNSFYKWEKGLENFESWRCGVLKNKKR